MSFALTGEDLESAFRSQLEARYGEIRDMMGRAKGVLLTVGGALERADLRTDVAPLSSQVRWALQNSADCLGNLLHLIEARGELPDVSSFVLIRGAIEGAMNALWLLGPGKGTDRVARALDTARWHHEEAVKFLDQINRLGAGVVDRETFDAERREYMGELWDGVPELRQRRRDRKPPSITDKFLDVQRRFGSPTALTPLTVWTLCSGMAHANSSLAMMAFRLVPTGQQKSEHRAKASWALTYQLVSMTLWLFDRGVERFEVLASEA